jgi:Ca2+-transporting ATPase
MTHNEIQTICGLTKSEAKAILERDGYNEIRATKKKTIFHIILEVMKEPMFLLLVACGILYCILGDIQEALMLLGFVFVIVGITVYQEGKTEKALDALKDLSSPRALVIRDGERIRIAGREVVRKDWIVIAEGDRIPADCVLMWDMNIEVDESLLTGESVPVRKKAGTEEMSMERPGGEDTQFVYSGTLVVRGQGIALVKETGMATEMGKIGKALGNVIEEDTLIKRETGRIVKTVFTIAIIICSLVIVVYGLTRNDWIGGVLTGVTLAMAMLPEEFPVVLTIFLALGAWRISKKQVLTRKVAAIETLGAATVFCVDKTGTLTKNKMSIQKLYSASSFLDVAWNGAKPLPENFHELVEYGILASKTDPFDPMEKALKALGEQKLEGTEHIHDNWEIVQEYALSRELLALSHVWKSEDGLEYCIAAKGAPEAIMDLCHLPAEAVVPVENAIQTLAREGLRVLGVAKSSFQKQENLPSTQHDFDFEFLGLIGLADPIRETVPQAVSECHKAGIRIVMITGDYPITASNIAKQIGLINPEKYITGQELSNMSLEELSEKIKTVNIFARVVPEQKLLLVEALKKNGEIVSMTGDGVNDAPALKAANIGIAMGERGTDVAREASNLVLLDDSFPAIVEAVKIGRRIFDNLRKAMAYIVSVHIPIVGMSLIPVLLQWKELVLSPVHIVFLELIIDPACSVVFESEPEESNIMNRPPRKNKEHLFNLKTFLFSCFQGLFSLAVVFFVHQSALYIGLSADEARTLSFITLIVSNLCLILVNRNWTKTIFQMLSVKNKALIWVFVSSIAFLGIVIYVPFMRDLFHFSYIQPLHLAVAVIAGMLSVVWFEIAKLVMNRKKSPVLNKGMDRS